MEEYFVVNSRWKAVLFKTLLNMGWPVRWLPITLEKEKNPADFVEVYSAGADKLRERIAELEAENQRLREAHNDNLEEYEFFVKQDQTHSKLIDWKIVCGYLANRSKAALLAILLEENQDKIARFKAWEEQEWTKKPE